MGKPLAPSEQLINCLSLYLCLSQSFVFGKCLSVIVSTSVSSIAICCHFSLFLFSPSHTPYFSVFVCIGVWAGLWRQSSFSVCVCVLSLITFQNELCKKKWGEVCSCWDAFAALRSNTAFSLNNEPPEPIRTGAEKGMDSETRGLDDEMGEGWERHWGGGAERDWGGWSSNGRKKIESVMHVAFLCLFLIYTHVVDLKWNMHPFASFVLHLSEYQADIHHFLQCSNHEQLWKCLY